MENCATSTTLKLQTDPGDATRIIHRNKRSCRHGLCMQCARRRAAQTCKAIGARLTHVIEQNPTARFAFMTLTACNRPLAEVADMFECHDEALIRYWRRPEIRHAILGHVTAIEVALRHRDEIEVGVHSHSIVVLHPDYFDRACDRYLTHADIVANWRAALRCDYDPICDVRAIRDTPAVATTLRECIKYAVAPHALLDHGPFGISVDPDVAAHLARALYKRRMVRFGGVVAEAAKALRKTTSVQATGASQ